MLTVMRRTASRWSLLGRLRLMPPVIRLLVLTELAFNIGFYLVLPYLASHLVDDLAIAGWAVGLVLGLRTFSQQGMFFVGGLLTDRFGAKPMVLIGCAVRVSGFVVLGLTGTFAGVLVGVVLTGFAAALFSPAVEASLAHEAESLERTGTASRSDVFALSAVCGQIGAVVGPLLGVLLLGTGFRRSCLVAATGFLLLGIALSRWLPASVGPRASSSPAWRKVLGNRRFMLFAVGYSGYLFSYNQLYLALPLELHRISGNDALGWLFALASVMIVLGQLPLTAWGRRRLGRTRGIATGLALMAAGFAVVAVGVVLPGTSVWPAVVLVMLLTTGQMLAVPFAKDLVPRLADNRHLGAHFGMLASMGGVAVLLGSTATGQLFDRWPSSPIPWLFLAAVPAVCAVALGLLFRHLPRTEELVTRPHGVEVGPR